MTNDDGEATCAVIQAEDELAAAGMVLGVGWAGARGMTATSGPGISLMQEFIGLAYFAEIPSVSGMYVVSDLQLVCQHVLSNLTLLCYMREAMVIRNTLYYSQELSKNVSNSAGERLITPKDSKLSLWYE